MTLNIKEKIQGANTRIKTLKRVDIPEAQKNLDSAAADGDLRENSDYHLCYQRINGLNNQLVEWEKLLIELKEFDELLMKYRSTGYISLGSRVTLSIDGTDYEFQIVPPSIGDAASGLLASDSRLAESVMDRKAGERIEYKDNEHNGYTVGILYVD